MPKLLKLKNKPFWIATAIILIIGIAFYKQRSTEGFETTYNLVGALYYGKLKDLDDGLFTDGGSPLKRIIEAEDESEVWKKGETRPKDDDEKYYVLLMTPAAGVSKKDIEKTEKDMKSSSNADKEYRNGYVCAVVLNSKNSYRDKDDNKIIGAWTRFLGMNLLKSTLYWILGGVGALIFLIIIFMMMRNSGSSNVSNRYNNSNSY
jgi:hypothetical protein